MRSNMCCNGYKPDFEPNFDKFNQIIKFQKGEYTFLTQNIILLDYYGINAKYFSASNLESSKENPDILKFILEMK
ncbi:MAG: hypothetical protein Fur0024_5460 [Patescibacteria group bacterium]